jgi:hypothetical protein
MVALKLIPQLLAWLGIALVLLRGFPGRRTVVAAAGCGGFAAGTAGAALLLAAFPGDLGFGYIRDVVGGSLLLLWWISVAALYRSTVREVALFSGKGLLDSLPVALAGSLLAGTVAGAISAARLSGSAGAMSLLLLALAGAVAMLAARLAEPRLPAALTVSPAALACAVVALLLFGSSAMLRLDLFSPLTMKVMKFAHDFVHQFFESMLIPDHLFIRSYLWGYIGLLFGKEIGLWGGLLIWFTPVVLVALAINMERLPSVAHIRQGAQRRRLLADALRSRRIRVLVPACALLVFGAAVYQSRNPSVEYWDPKPVNVTANPSGEIFIPKKGEIDLEDGKLHKFLFKQGGREARFFVLLNAAGKFTVDLDACAICKPDGYGQAEGTVICYYCKTLIPLETVGKPGGCNPVPIAFSAKDDGVHIDGMNMLKVWGETVQTTTKVKEGGK